MGLKAVYQTNSDHLPIRLFSQLSTDVTLPGRKMTMALFGVQLGVPMYSQKISKTASSETQPSVAQSSDEVRLYLDPKKVFFATNSASLKRTVDGVFHDVGDYLEKNPNEWGKIEIMGHADQRGSFKYNLKLSHQRARSVQKALLTGGADPARLKTVAYSYSKPLKSENNRKAWAYNRRVEIVFYKVQHPIELIEKLEPLLSDRPVY